MSIVFKTRRISAPVLSHDQVNQDQHKLFENIRKLSTTDKDFMKQIVTFPKTKRNVKQDVNKEKTNKQFSVNQNEEKETKHECTNTNVNPEKKPPIAVKKPSITLTTKPLINKNVKDTKQINNDYLLSFFTTLLILILISGILVVLFENPSRYNYFIKSTMCMAEDYEEFICEKDCTNTEWNNYTKGMLDGAWYCLFIIQFSVIGCYLLCRPMSTITPKAAVASRHKPRTKKENVKLIDTKHLLQIIQDHQHFKNYVPKANVLRNEPEPENTEFDWNINNVADMPVINVGIEFETINSQTKFNTPHTFVNRVVLPFPFTQKIK